MICELCGFPVTASRTLLRGSVIMRCERCRDIWLEGDTMRVSPDYDGLRLLAIRRDELHRQRIEHEILTSDIDDPRWIRIDGGF